MARLALLESGKIWLGGNVRLLRAVALGAGLACALPALAGCSSDEIENDGSIRGTLMVYVATMDDGTSRTEYQLQIGGNEHDERILVFTKTPPEAVSGAEIKVWGDSSGREIIVNRFELREREKSSSIGKSQEAIIGGSPYPARTFAYVLVDLGGGITRRSGGNSVPYTAAEAEIDVYGTGTTDASVKQWFLENSYGRQDLGGDVVTGLEYSMSGCNYSNLASTLRSQVNSQLGMTPQHYLWYFGTNVSGCGWSGLASVGEPGEPARDTWYNASSSCVVLVQEPAHNFGMQHSSALECDGAPFANDPSDCEHSEYGDSHDPMGGGCRHTNAWQKAYQGWFGGCNRVRVNTSGMFNLLPIETACNGIQVLQIPFPTTGLPSGGRVIPRSGGGGQASNDPVGFYYLELRTRTGFDESQTAYPTVLVRVGPDWRGRTQSGRHTWILDMNTSSQGLQGMGSGATFMDPAGGVSFTVQSISAAGAVVNVTVPTTTANACADTGTLATPSGPTTCGDGGMGGMAGMAGMAGMGGAPGGAGGTGGAGAGGIGGMVGGAAGSGGTAGIGGALAGSGGIAAGAGGAAGLAGGGAGGIVVAGAAGAPIAGTGMAGAAGAGVAGTGAFPIAESELDPGCSCRVQKAPRRNEAALLFGLFGLVVGGLLRRRNGRAA